MTEDITGIYQHFKGKEYEVIGVGFHSETREKLVFYKQLYDSDTPKGTLWARPFDMFFEEVVKPGYKGPRFFKIKDVK